MNRRIKNWLSTPYYFNPSLLFKLKTSFTLGLFVFIFLYVFKPFTLSSFKGFLLEYTTFIGLFTFIWSFCILFVSPLIFKSYFNEDKWTIGKNLFLIMISVLVFGTFLWLFAGVYKKDKNVENLSLPLYLLYTFLVGSIPTIFLILINERNVRKKRIQRIEEIKDYKKRNLRKKIDLEKKVTIYSDNTREKLSFTVDNLVYITSQGNYASFFFKTEKNNFLKEKILRVTLSKIEKELEAYSKVIRCHKSYIVNTAFINDISGNARGYMLKSDILSFNIPVSRSFSKQSLMSFLD